MLAYGQSKTAKVLFAVELDRELKTPQQAAGTTVFAATSALLDDIGGVYRGVGATATAGLRYGR